MNIIRMLGAALVSSIAVLVSGCIGDVSDGTDTDALGGDIGQISEAIEFKAENGHRHCVAIAHGKDQPDAPVTCFPDIPNLKHHVATNMNTAGAGYALLMRLYTNPNFSGNSLWIYGLACNAYGELSSLGWMNNQASSFILDCHGLVSGYYWNQLYPDQNFRGPFGSLFSQVNDSSGNLYWPSNDNWESFRNTANPIPPVWP